LVARLETSNIAPALAEYLIQEVEAGITQLADPCNRGVQHMSRLDMSPAAVMARRILEDPWVLSRTKQLQHLKIQIPVVISLLRISVGGVSQFLVATASWVFLMQIVSGFGSEAVAGYTIAVRVVMFSILPAWGLSNAAATLVGQNLGAGLPERAEATVWKIVKYNSIYMGIASVLMLLFIHPIVEFFTQEPVVVGYAV
jgi:Na+-driven multidrug efflux pump